MKKVLLCALFVIAAVGLTSVSVFAAESDENKFWEEYLEAVPEGSVANTRFYQFSTIAAS